MLDQTTILDAQGIQKITEITTRAAVGTNELKQSERMEIGRQNLQADEAVYRFEQQRADAEAKRDKEIVISQSRESNEGIRIQLEERKRTAVDKEKVEEEIRLAAEAKQRAIEVAEQSRLREVGVEQVRVAKARDLEEVERKREVALGDIEREKQLEVERKGIADVIRARVAVDKTVAVEEEGIKDLRATADARRTKEVTVITAEAEATESLIKQTREAEAAELVAQADARKQLTLAEAALEAADRQAKAKIRMAEGVRAESAAQGLAEVQVRDEAVAVAEREGLVEATVIREKGQAAAQVKQADAAALELMGAAEARALEQKLEAMKALEGSSREHEEFRLRLDKEREIELAELRARVEMAEHQAKVMSAAMSRANLNIVGGDGAFFDRFVKAVTLGHSIDGVVDSSDTLRSLLAKRLGGGGDLIADLKEVVAGAGASSEAIKNLSISAVLAKLMIGADDTTRSKLQMLLEKAKALGIDSEEPS
jgi:uncharacterized membrane protein YqiK